MPKTVALHLNKAQKNENSRFINLIIRSDSISLATDYTTQQNSQQLEEALREALLKVVEHNKLLAAQQRRQMRS